MKISAVITMYNHYDLTHQLLYDIFNNSRSFDEVVVVDNGSTEVTGLHWWEESDLLPLDVIRVTENEGFLRAANRGVRMSHGDLVVLLSNDVRVHGNLGVVAKSTLRIYPNSLLGGKVYQNDTGWNTFNGKTYPYAEGWCLGFSRSAWDLVGGFDERYAPNDYEDVDLSTMFVAMGSSLVEMAAGLVEHIGAQTISYGSERQALTERNREKFKEKWNIQ
jgi:GT2 family glycosyltransferase